jgi:hypothetical protein
MFLEATEKKHIENEASNLTGWHSKGSARLPGGVLDLCIMFRLDLVAGSPTFPFTFGLLLGDIPVPLDHGY